MLHIINVKLFWSNNQNLCLISIELFFKFFLEIIDTGQIPSSEDSCQKASKESFL